MSTAEEIRATIERAYLAKSVRGRDGRTHDITSVSVSAERGEFLYRICRAERPRNTLEIGMAWGLSTLFMLLSSVENAIASPRHVVMDPDQSSRFHDAARISVSELGLDSIVEFHPEPSGVVLPRLVAEGRQFDLAFIDGNHGFDGVFIDLYFVNQLVRPGGVIIFDDANWDGVFLASRFAEMEYGYRVLDQVGASSRDAQMRAYRKPESQPLRRTITVAPFFEGFTPRSEHGKAAMANKARHRGLVALARGKRKLARRYLRVAERLDPLHLKTWFRLARTYLPMSMIRATSGRPRS